MKVATIVGARPQFIKAAPLSKALHEAGCQEYIIHTGQHYDYEMSQVFFDELGLPNPNVNLNVRSGTHGKQTGEMLIRIEQVLIEQKPDYVIVFGDTNSTLAGALATVKLRIPLIHIEAGLRSFNREMPEEHNRVLTDHCSDWLFCPTQTAVDNLAKEGITKGVQLVGDPMYDAVLMFADRARHQSTILERLMLEKSNYYLVTIHRSYNTDNPEILRSIFTTLFLLEKPIVFPIHPRTRTKLHDLGIMDEINANGKNLYLIDPVSYLDMLVLEQNAQLIMTDSGGVQKEAFFFTIPCLTLRSETEWAETVQSGWNLLVGTEKASILAGINHKFPIPKDQPKAFGDGMAANAIISKITNMEL